MSERAIDRFTASGKDTAALLASNSASLMEITLSGVTGSLPASNFKAHA